MEPKASPKRLTGRRASEGIARWREMESVAAAQAMQTPAPSRHMVRRETPGSAKVRNVLFKHGIQYLLGRVAANDPVLGALDLSNNAQFLGLTTSQKDRAIEILATGRSLHTLKLNSLGLDNSHAGAVAKLLRSEHKLQAFSLEGNNFTEPGILVIAEALIGHRHLQELSVAHQRSQLSTAAAAAMVDAMEGLPTLVQLGLGTLRDAGMRWKVQTLQSKALERLRTERQKRVAGASDEVLSPIKPRRSLNEVAKPPSTNGGLPLPGEGDASSAPSGQAPSPAPRWGGLPGCSGSSRTGRRGRERKAD